MPRSRSALESQLQIAERELAQVESRLLETINADKASKLVERAVDLTTLVLELKNNLDDLLLESGRVVRPNQST
jgi:hypothetical protein